MIGDAILTSSTVKLVPLAAANSQQFSRDAEGRRHRHIVSCTARAAGLYKPVEDAFRLRLRWSRWTYLGRSLTPAGRGRSRSTPSQALLPARPVTSRPGQLTPPDDPDELPGPRTTLGQPRRGGAGRRCLLVVEGWGGHGSGPCHGVGTTIAPSRTMLGNSVC